VVKYLLYNYLKIYYFYFNLFAKLWPRVITLSVMSTTNVSNSSRVFYIIFMKSSDFVLSLETGGYFSYSSTFSSFTLSNGE